MLKSSLLAACLLGALAFGANVTLADDAKPSAPQTKPTAPQAKPAFPKAGCTHDTGSRLPRADGCLGVGRSYSQDDISSTGQPGAGGAMRQLDPSIRGH